MTANAYYSTSAWDTLRANLALEALMEHRSIPNTYRSVWRVLHVDGFEQKWIRVFLYDRFSK